MTASTAGIAEHSRGLDVVRGLAALLVVLGHARVEIFRAHDLDPGGAGLFRLLLVPTSLAQEAVAVFFVLSGYLVGGQVLRQVRAGRFSWRSYLAKRGSRLWTVLVPGLVLTALVDALIRLLPGGTQTSAATGNGGLATALCNALFLAPGRCAPYGSNESLWSLGYELWFYVVFAAATVAVGVLLRRGPLVVVLVNGAIAVGGVAAFGLDLLRLLPAWLVGVAVAELRARSPVRDKFVLRRSPLLAWAGVLAVLAAGLLASNLLAPPPEERGLTPGALPMLLVALATVPLVWCCLAATSSRSRRWEDAGAWLGSWSFSLYVFHLPLVVLVATATRSWWGADLGISTVALYAVSALVVGAVHPLYRLTEQHTEAVRDVALRLVGVGRPAASVPPADRPPHSSDTSA